jgi:transcriptional regulator with XRE-family HTH domain
VADDRRDEDDDRTAAASARVTGEVLRLLKLRGISRSELARRLDASPAHITQILRGGTNFTLASLEKLAAALGAALEVHFAPVGEVAEPVEPKARTRATAEPLATGTEATRDRPRRRDPTRRRERPRPARPPEPDSTWRVW